MYRAIKVALDPTPSQIKLLNSHCGAARFAYNAVLKYIESEFKSGNNIKINFYDLRKWWNQNKDILAPWWKENSKECYANAIANLCTAYKNYFNSLSGKRKGKVGEPNKKKRTSNRSFTMSSGYFDVDGKHLKLSKIGLIHCFENIEKRIKNCKMKSCTVSFDGLRWFVSILVEDCNDNFYTDHKQEFVGIDLGLLNLATTSDGELIDNKRFLDKYEQKLKKELKSLARKQGFRKGERKSKRYIKQLIKVRKTYAKIRNCRIDNIEKITTEICKFYKNIAIEDLNVKNMQKNHKLAKSLSDASFGLFRACLIRKAKKHGNTIYLIDKFYPSSKTCSNCGQVKAKLSLNERTYVCEYCGIEIDRDFNAALNLENIARSVAESTSETLNAHGENVRLVSLDDIKQISLKCESGLYIRLTKPEVLVCNDEIL